MSEINERRKLLAEHTTSIKEELFTIEVKKRYSLYFFLFFILGSVNNLGWVLVGTTSSRLANELDMKNFMPLFQLGLISFNILIRFLNARYFLLFRHSIRMYINTLIMLLGYGLMTVALLIGDTAGFVLSLVASVCQGIGSAFGETVMLGYMKSFPSKILGAWSSGTGMAGFLGAGLYLLLAAVELDLLTIYLVSLIFVLFYIFAFIYMNRRKVYYQKVEENHQRESMIQANEAESQIEVVDNVEDIHENYKRSIKSGGNASIKETQHKSIIEKIFKEDVNEANENMSLNCINLKRIINGVGFLVFNLAFVYFLEYMCLTCFCDRIVMKVNKGKDSDDLSFVKREAYAIMCFCYQIGVFASRSSLSICRIKHVEILTIFQAINYFLAFIDALALYYTEYWGIFGFQIWVGLMGGGSYVNVIFTLLNKPDLHYNERELATTFCTFFDSFGIFMASLISLIFDQTFLHVD